MSDNCWLRCSDRKAWIFLPDKCNSIYISVCRHRISFEFLYCGSTFFYRQWWCKKRGKKVMASNECHGFKKSWNTFCSLSKLRYGLNELITVQLWNYRQYLRSDCTSTENHISSAKMSRKNNLLHLTFLLSLKTRPFLALVA